jgi:hypothetical protein
MIKELLREFTLAEWIQIIGGAVIILPLLWAGMTMLIIIGG